MGVDPHSSRGNQTFTDDYINSDDSSDTKLTDMNLENLTTLLKFVAYVDILNFLWQWDYN